jgi:hypothetical protein
MKNLNLFSSILLKLVVFILLASGCKKTEETVQEIIVKETGTVNLSISNTVDGIPVEMNQLIYTNTAGNLYSVGLLKYYLSNFVLVKQDGSKEVFNQYELIDAELSGSGEILLADIKNGTYKSIIFNIGVDSLRNHKGDQTGDLSPQNGMIWTWNTGYIFLKHEGSYVNSSSENNNLMIHYGTDVAFTTVEVAIDDLVIEGNSKKLKLAFDLNKLYSSPNQVDFNDDDNMQSNGNSDLLWISRVRDNFNDSFIFKGIE